MSDHILTTFHVYDNKFSILKAHITGLIFGIIGWIVGWYGLVLITATVSNGDSYVKGSNGWLIKPKDIQNLGILFAILMGIVTWFQRMAAVQGGEQ
jgi:hypothetical protein